MKHHDKAILAVVRSRQDMLCRSMQAGVLWRLAHLTRSTAVASGRSLSSSAGEVIDTPHVMEGKFKAMYFRV